MTIAQAKKDLIAKLKELDIPFTKIVGKTVDFSDLARGSKIFLTIQGLDYQALKLRPETFQAFWNFRDTKGKGYIVKD